METRKTATQPPKPVLTAHTTTTTTATAVDRRGKRPTYAERARVVAHQEEVSADLATLTQRIDTQDELLTQLHMEQQTMTANLIKQQRQFEELLSSFKSLQKQMRTLQDQYADILAAINSLATQSNQQAVEEVLNTTTNVSNRAARQVKAAASKPIPASPTKRGKPTNL